MTSMRFTIVLAFLVFAVVGLFGCGEDSSPVCETACNRLADRFDDCNVSPKVLPGAPGSELTASRLCNQELETPSAEQENTCSQFSDTIYRVLCSKVSAKAEAWSGGSSPETWIDVMKGLL